MDSDASTPLEALFPSKARRALLEALFSGAVTSASVSELARRARLTSRAVSVEVENLQKAGLVEVEAMGSAHVVRANESHPVTTALKSLLDAALSFAGGAVTERCMTRESLAAYGAPLLGDEPRRHFTLAETVLRGLKLARTDATVLRVLPLVVARHAHEFDWTDLRERARRMNLKAELGMLLELTSDVASLPALRGEAVHLHDGRRKRERFFLPVHGPFERKLAQMRTPASVAHWGFVVNMPEDAFREVLRKHGAERARAPSEAPAFGEQVSEPTPNDLTLKIARGYAHDLQAVAEIHAAHPLDRETLVARYFETRTQIIGSPETLKLNFLAAVETLYGEGIASDVAARLDAPAGTTEV